MAKTLDLYDFITPDQMANQIAEQWTTWNTHRADQVARWKEQREYVYQTDTTQTNNSSLPWKNTTTTPKLCQIRDNLFANYFASVFPKRKWLIWEGATAADEVKEKAAAIRDYMSWVISQPWFKDEIRKLIYDWIDYGNCFVIPTWVDETHDIPSQNRQQVGYVGPGLTRINPLDITMNPIAPTFVNSPKIVRSLVSFGEARKMLEAESSTDEQRTEAEALFQYMKDIRSEIVSYDGNIHIKDEYFKIDGFDTFQSYLSSNYVEVLTFYGDLYDAESNTFLENHIITVLDRHKVAYKKPNPSYFGYPPVFHSGWRMRQDNLWAMGPLENLVGLQYRIDHVENAKADLFDLTVIPPLKIKGYVEDFTWGPMEKIYVSEEGDVELMTPRMDIITANIEVQTIEAKMEEMAGAPKEAMGFRTPGEKTMFEVQRLENAASRIFQSKIAQFEEQILEPVLNAMLELARRQMGATTIRTIDDDFNMGVFKQLTPQDITGSGRIRPVGARHFAERAERLQTFTTLYTSALGQDPMVQSHFSSIKVAKFIEELMDVEEYEMVDPFIRLSEQADGQRLANSHEENVLTEAQTPAGIAEDDFDDDSEIA